MAVRKPVKKPAAKKSVAKKPVAKKKSSKTILTKRTTAKKPRPNRVPPTIISRKAMPVKEDFNIEMEASEKAKMLDFVMSIAAEMKRAAAKAEIKAQKQAEEDDIRLSRRPVTRAQGKDTVKFPAADLKEFRRRLIEARENARNGVNAMKATGFNESEDHEADGGDGTNQTLRLQALGQMGNINRVLQQIDEALHRIDDGTYGVCTVCGQLIRKPRLMNQPFVLTCMECQNEMERAH